jgi:hypothetical protein
MGGNSAVLAVAVAACTQEHDRAQRNPATHRVHHHAASKVMELRARAFLQPRLHTVVLVPDNALK